MIPYTCINYNIRIKYDREFSFFCYKKSIGKGNSDIPSSIFMKRKMHCDFQSPNLLMLYRSCELVHAILQYAFMQWMQRKRTIWTAKGKCADPSHTSPLLALPKFEHK